MQRQFDHTADEFTLEKIIEYGFDQFAEPINEISGAATKELAIEQVSVQKKKCDCVQCFTSYSSQTVQFGWYLEEILQNQGKYNTNKQNCQA